MKTTRLLSLLIFCPLSLLAENYDGWFEHSTAIIAPDGSCAPVLDELEAFAKKRYGWLNGTKDRPALFFDSSRRKDSYLVNKEFHGQNCCHSCKAYYSEIPITTEDGEEISISYFDRGKDAVVLVGPGFTNGAEEVAPFVDILHDYDVACLNFRGLGIHTSETANPINWLLKDILSVTNHTQLGIKEHLDIAAAVSFLRSELGYKKVYGVSICMGSFAFARSQSFADRDGIKLFDKLILDGTVVSFEQTISRVASDPRLVISPQKGGWEHGSAWLKSMLETFLVNFSYVAAHIDYEGTELPLHVHNLSTIPTLLIHSKHDKMVSQDEFVLLWKTIQTPHLWSVVTSNDHVNNHIKQKELYTVITKSFLEMDEFGIFYDEATRQGQRRDAIEGALSSGSTISRVTHPRIVPPKDKPSLWKKYFGNTLRWGKWIGTGSILTWGAGVASGNRKIRKITADLLCMGAQTLTKAACSLTS